MTGLPSGHSNSTSELLLKLSLQPYGHWETLSQHLPSVYDNPFSPRPVAVCQRLEAAYSAHNDRVEKVHLIVLDDVETLLGSPARYSAEAASHFAYTRTHTPSPTSNTIGYLDWQTGNKPTVDHLYPFGCKLYYRDHRQTSKLQPRYKAGRLLGYADESHTCRVGDATSKRIVLTKGMFCLHNMETLQLQHRKGWSLDTAIVGRLPSMPCNTCKRQILPINSNRKSARYPPMPGSEYRDGRRFSSLLWLSLSWTYLQ